MMRYELPQSAMRGERKEQKMSLGIVILAAGKGTRMNSKKQKILHAVGGKPMVAHVMESAEALADIRPVFVVGPDDTGVEALFGERGEYVIQAEQLGTGHATLMAKTLLLNRTEQIIVTYGDMPLIRTESLAMLAEEQARSGAAVVLTTVRGEPTSSFGRIVRDGGGRVCEICEVAEAKRRPNREELLAITELNVGVYCFSADFLWQNIDQLPLRQARSGPEYYLTDMIAKAVEQQRLVMAVEIADADECLGAGTRAELVDVERAFRQRAVRDCLANGVTIIDPATTYIDQGVKIGRDTIIWPNTFIQGEVIIGEDCVIGPNTTIRAAAIGDGCQLAHCYISEVVVPQNTLLEPYSVVLAEYRIEGEVP